MPISLIRRLFSEVKAPFSRCLLIFLWALLGGSLASAQGGIALIQHRSKDAGSTASSSLAFNSNNTAGNWIGVCIRAGKSGQLFSVADSRGNIYHQAVQFNVTVDTPNGDTLGIFYAENIAGGANTITVSDTILGTLRFAILEYSGVALANSLETTAVGQGSSASPSTANTTTLANGDLLLSAILSANAATFAAGSGYTLEEFVPGVPNTKLIAEDQIQTIAGTVSASASLGLQDKWGAGLAAFKPANGGAAGAIITPTAGTPQSAVINTAFATQLQATVKDGANNPVSGATVAFAAPASGASGTFAGGVNTATTNMQGVATAPTLTANSVAGGPYSVTASVTGATTPASFLLTNLSGAPASITATAGTPQSATINTAFATRLQTTVKDGGNNPVSGATVTFTAPASGASGRFAVGVNTATTDGQGMATAPIFTANSVAGGPYSVTASVAGVATQANFSLTNLAVSASGIALVQHRSKDAGTIISSSLAFNSNNTAGNWIGVCIRAGRSGQLFSITDSRGNIYHQAVQFNVTIDSPGGDTLGIFYAENIAGGANTITVSDTILGTLRFAILEYSGVALANSLEATAVGQGSSASPSTANTTTIANGDLLLGAILTGSTAIFAAGSGYTIEENVPAEPNTKLIAEDQIQTAAGTSSASASLSAADAWGAGLAAFRPTSAGPPPPISVKVLPGTASVPAGPGTQGFTATLQNDFLNKGVTWALSGAGCNGNTCGTLSTVATTSVTYTAPANVPNPATVALTATSVADNTKSDSATITVIPGPLSVAVSPKRAGVTLSQTQQFTVSVFNDPKNGGVVWSVDGNNGGNATTGTITVAGLFTPGSQVGPHTVTATSVSDASVSASAAVAVTDLTGVLTHHNDAARTGQNLKEYALSPTTVSSSTFGQLFSCPVDGFVYAEPLYVANLAVGGMSRNVVYIATEHDSVYAFDADSASCAQLWKVSFLKSGVTSVPWQDVGGTNDLIPEIGITSTPVIDLATNTIYVEAKTKETVGTGCSTGSPCYFHSLHTLDLSTGLVSGAEKLGAPVVISAPNFNSLRHLQRPALLLANNTIYLGFGSHGDIPNWQGWMFGYDATTLAQKFAWSTTDPTSGNGGGAIWGGGAGPALDSSGNIYFSTGNGSFNANATGGKNYADSTVKLSATGSLLDYFTPFNQSTFAANDIDLGSAGVVILADAVGSALHPHLALATGKVGILYLLDQTNMSKFHSGSNQDVQEVVPVPPPNTTNLDGGIFGLPAYWNGSIYVTGVAYPLQQFLISSGNISSPANSKSNNTFPLRGATPAVSANGTSGGIVWVLDLTAWQANQPAILDAYDATDLSKLLYSSPSSGTGAAGPAVKFTVPTVANGKVYVGGQSTFSVFGLLPN